MVVTANKLLCSLDHILPQCGRSYGHWVCRQAGGLIWFCGPVFRSLSRNLNSFVRMPSEKRFVDLWTRHCRYCYHRSIWLGDLHSRRSRWPHSLRRSSAAGRLLGLRVWIPLGAWMFVVSVVCCQVEVSATGQSLVRRSTTACVCECVCVCVCVGVSLIVINATNYLHLQWVGS